MTEEAQLLGKDRDLVGVVTRPTAVEVDSKLPAFLLLNAGSVHHVGPNRLYVKIARHLASLGFVALRFDFAGIGDSPRRRDRLPFGESAVRQTQEAMHHLTAKRGIERFVLMGLCSGAVFSYRMATIDPRVTGAVLINGWGHLHDGADGRLPPHMVNRVLVHYYTRIALHSSFRTKVWRRALAGGMDYGARVPLALKLARNRLFGRRKQTAPVEEDLSARMQQLAERGVCVLHIYSEGDKTLDYLQVALGDRLPECSRRGWLDVRIVRGTNHTFTPLWKQQELVDIIGTWAQNLPGEPRAAAASLS